jgi:hypothetical protein
MPSSTCPEARPAFALNPRIACSVHEYLSMSKLGGVITHDGPAGQPDALHDVRAGDGVRTRLDPHSLGGSRLSPVHARRPRARLSTRAGAAQPVGFHPSELS